MQIKLQFRRRPVADEDIVALNSDLLNKLSAIKELWTHDGVALETELNLGQGESATNNLTSCLSDGLSGQLSYASRFYVGIGDKAINDDLILLNLDTNKVEIGSFIKFAFSSLIEAFSAYRAVVNLDKSLVVDDHEAIVEQTIAAQAKGIELDLDGRHGVYRINSVNYFDRLLCQRAFNTSPEEIVVRLQGKVEQVSLLNDGVLLIYSSDLMARSELEKIDAEIRPLIMG